jgi:hypothetical protein
MLAEISIGSWVLLFVIYFAFDLCYALYIKSVHEVKPIRAANLSVLLFLLTAYGTIEYVNSFINIIPIILGAWTGSYLTLKWGKRHSETDS